MKDFLGNDVAVGDKIFYSTTGRWPESRLAVVVRFTAKSMFVDILRTNRGTLPLASSDVRVQNDFVIVEKAVPATTTDDGKIIFRKVSNTAYEGPQGQTLRREWGVHDANGNPIEGYWVLRDEDGAFVDYDQYQNDIAPRNHIVLE